MRKITIETTDELLAKSITYLALRANAQVVADTIAVDKVETTAVEEVAKEPK